MKSRFTLPQILAVFFIVLAISCTKEKSSGSDAEQEEVSRVSSESDAEAEIFFNGLFDDVMGVNNDVGMAGTGIFGRAATTGFGETARLTACYTLTITRPGVGLFPVRVVIDFGPTPCLGADGHTRSGKIISEYSGRLLASGAVAVTTFRDFFFDSTRIEGTHKITNMSSTTIPISRKFKVEVIDAKLTRHNGNFIEWNSTKTIEQFEGLLTPEFPLDDVFKMTGGSRGKALRGNLLVAWQSSVIEPLIKRFTCRWISKGTIKTLRANVTTNEEWIAVLNFGNGTCDNHAVIVINGIAHQITLR